MGTRGRSAVVRVAEMAEQAAGDGDNTDAVDSSEAEPRPQGLRGTPVVMGVRVGVGQADGGRGYWGKPPRTMRPDPQSMESARRSPFLAAGCRESGELGPC